MSSPGRSVDWGFGLMGAVLVAASLHHLTDAARAGNDYAVDNTLEGTEQNTVEVNTEALDEAVLNFTRELELNRNALRGQVFRERYHLEEFLRSDVQVGQKSGVPGPGYWPWIPGFTSLDDISKPPEHINAGSFGDTWRGRDMTTNQNVAIKIFYSNCEAPCKPIFLTHQNAKPPQIEELRRSVQECTLVQSMMASKHMYPAGAEHICECYREHVSDSIGTNKPVFLVQELCGRDLQYTILERSIEVKGAGQPGSVAEARRIIFQTCQALTFLQMFQVPVVHRDLKPGNVNYVEGTSNMNAVKVIDWGLNKFAHVNNQGQGAAGTPGYVPPEVVQTGVAFGMPAWSFDIYSTGVMYMQLLCPSLVLPGIWNYKDMKHPENVDISEAFINEILKTSCPYINIARVADDVRLIAQMTKWYPQERPHPKDVLRATPFDIFRGSFAPQREEAPVRGRSMLPIGTEIEYFSPSTQQWWNGIVAGYSVSRNTYNLYAADGVTAMKEAAPAAQVRPKTDGLKEGDLVAYTSTRYGVIQARIVAINPDGTYNLASVDMYGGFTIPLTTAAHPGKVERWKMKLDDALQMHGNSYIVGQNVAPAPVSQYQFAINEQVYWKNPTTNTLVPCVVTQVYTDHTYDLRSLDGTITVKGSAFDIYKMR